MTQNNAVNNKQKNTTQITEKSFLIFFTKS